MLLYLAAGIALASPLNVLVVVIDDLGVDKVGLYGVGREEVPPTPTLDRLGAEGVHFTRAYAMPSCSPSRATAQTGRQPWQHRIARPLSPRGPVSLRLEEITIPEMLRLGTDGAYESSALGKWHLGSFRSDLFNHANDQGYDFYAGQMGDLGPSHSSDGSPMSYYHWEKNTNGALEWVETYVTTDTANDAIARIDAMEPPWFMWMAFNAPHAPWHEPPPELTTEPVGTTSVMRKYNAAAEAVDTELGRVLAHLDESEHADDTLVLVLGDNGSPPEAASPPFDETTAKGTVYEGGVRVPLIARGPVVTDPGRAVDHLVQISDLFATIADAAEVDLSRIPVDIQSRSLMPYLVDPDAPSRREVVYSESFGPVRGPYTYARRMIRDERYKLVQKWLDGSETLHELYDLEGLDVEGENLMEGVLTPSEREAYLRLAAELPWSVPE